MLYICVPGPDRFDTYVVEDEARNQDIGEGNGMDFPPHVPLAVLGGAVLHIQGDELASQPMHDTSGGCLLWNGEIFGGLERRSEVIDGDVVTSDTCLVSAMLAETLSEIDNRNESDELTICTEIATKASLCLATIEGKNVGVKSYSIHYINANLMRNSVRPVCLYLLSPC
jgi:hypothetical protein